MHEILKLDVAGVPERWISPEDAACYYATDSVAWTLGDILVTFHGGINRVSGRQSLLELHPIVAVRGSAAKGNLLAAVPNLTNRALFKRDRHTCAYCVQKFPESKLTRDHIVPMSRGGRNAWSNCLSACARCNHLKGARLLHEIGWQPAYIPYIPNHFEGLLLAGRKILGCQHEFLSSGLPAHSRLS
jgi:5-methylcytosine-specific restriction endonuclease McrA